MANTEAYVSTGKPKVAGSVYSAAAGSTLPTSATASLDAAFVAMGYCAEDGLVNSTESNVDRVHAWGGDTVLVITDDREETFQITFIEALNVNVLKEVYGQDNVTGSLANGITVEASAAPTDARAWVIDMVLKNDVLKRIVIPYGTVTAIGDISYLDNEPIGYPLTISCAADSDGNYHYEYIQSAS